MDYKLIYAHRLGGRGRIAKADLDSLPTTIKEDLLNTATIGGLEDGHVCFRIKDTEDARRIDSLIRQCIRRRHHSERRARSLDALSHGAYEPVDIEELFDAQEGLCYYTGVPLSWKPRNFAIDHIVPVCDGGSSWPGNLALALKEANQEKHDRSKREFIYALTRRHGKEWGLRQREYRKRVDVRRMGIDRRRRSNISLVLAGVEERLAEAFPAQNVVYELEGDRVRLLIGLTEVAFPGGFIRRKTLFGSYEYVHGIVTAIAGART